MILRYALPDGEEKRFKIEKEKITIGRGFKVDLTVADKLASRLHCSIESKNGVWHVHDLNSRNGTFLNGAKIKSAELVAGDRITIGGTDFVFERAAAKGTETVIRELKNEMDGGKGFKTMLIEIVGSGREEKGKKRRTDDLISS